MRHRHKREVHDVFVSCWGEAEHINFAALPTVFVFIEVKESTTILRPYQSSCQSFMSYLGKAEHINFAASLFAFVNRLCQPCRFSGASTNDAFVLFR